MKKSRWTVLALQGAFFAGLIVLWQLASALKLFPEMFFPSPLQASLILHRPSHRSKRFYPSQNHCSFAFRRS